jgi:hypothetical protein
MKSVQVELPDKLADELDLFSCENNVAQASRL